MEFKELLAAFAAKYGTKELEGADDVAELYVEGVHMELLNDSRTHSLLAYAEIGHPPPDAADKFGAMMLEANFLLRGTEGATLCRNPETHAYALLHSFPLASTDVETLAAGLESLASHTESWRKALAGLHAAETGRAKHEESGDSHHDMLSSGYFRV
ncbi:MAG: type III secretion system chaperone [Kiritimatiellae bacterium]|nr:type III secretion system chaperone [Kiritimatiellia bacterium]